MQIPLVKTAYDRSMKFNQDVVEGLPTRPLTEAKSTGRFTKRKRSK
jgi:hypothetical protein